MSRERQNKGQNRNGRKYTDICRLPFSVALFLLATVLPLRLAAQTADTGAIVGNVQDSTGNFVPSAEVRVINDATSETLQVATHNNGGYVVPYLLPGKYRVEVSKSGFRVAILENVTVHVTETQRLDIRLEVGTVSEKIEVTAKPTVLDTESVALGNVTNQRMVEALPLVSRNYTQIITLSPAVSSEVNNAGSLGSGASSQASGTVGVAAMGGTTNSNNYQMDGVEVNDAFGGGVTGGVPVPNPDTIEEFKVQTGQYDAAYGRSSGADVDVVTKTGGNQFHGSVFEFFRNDVLNANDYFRNELGLNRPELKQNQFGFTLGGPILKDKLHFFASYQGTRQRNGVDPNCSGTFVSPPLTNDRSQAALGALFANNTVATIAPDGSNISPVALAILQAKLPDGSYVIPTPQSINPSLPFASQGLASISEACPYSEDQYMANLEYIPFPRNRIAARSFVSNSNKVETLPIANFTDTPALPGFPLTNPLRFRVFSLSDTYTISPNLINQAVLGYHRAVSDQNQSVPSVTLPGQSSVPFRWSTLGATISPVFDQQGPAGIVTPNGSAIGGFGLDTPYTQNYYDFEDTMSYIHGRHTFQFGGGLSRTQTDFAFVGFEPTVEAPQDWGAFLQGQTLFSADLQGETGRALRAWNIDGFGQDQFQVSPRLTLLVGLRYEFQGLLGDSLGRASNVNLSALSPNPPASGTDQGYVVASNYRGTLPPGVERAPTTAALDGTGENTFGPRLGFNWALPGIDRVVLRGGYGIYYGRTTGQPFFQLVASPPFSLISNEGAPPLNSPFAPPFSGFPIFPPFSPTSFLTPTVFQPTFRPPVIQNFSLSLQTALQRDLVLEVGYVGAIGTHLVEQRLYNQALSASPTSPVNGATSNTYDNILQRVPYQGIFVDDATMIDTEGYYKYNALAVSLRKRFSHGLQFLASYTWARDLTTDAGTSTANNGGSAIGDQDLAQHAFVDRLDLHRCLVGLDLGDHVTGLDGLAFLLQPARQRALGHCGRKRRHQDVGGHVRAPAQMIFLTASTTHSGCGSASFSRFAA